MLMAGPVPLTAFVWADNSDPIPVADWQTLQNAVNNSSDNTVKIRVTKDLTVSSGNAHNAGKTIEIDLQGHTIDGNSQQVFWNEKGSMTIKNGTIKNGKSDYGGAVNNRGTMTLEDINITNCSAIQGGGILNYGTLTMADGSVKDCSAGRGGAIRIVPHDSDSSEIARSATAALTNVEISGNTADGRNKTYGRGGGIGVSNGTLTMTGCTVSNNKSTDDDGGGIDFDSSEKTLTLKNTEISGNSVTQSEREGGGINLERGSAKIEDCTISGNAAPDGGGIYISDTFGTATICGTTKVTDNEATTYGGGGITSKATLELKDDITVTGNTAGETHTGGIYHSGSAIRMQGKIVVKDNSNYNVLLAKSKVIDVTGVIDDASNIGVSLTSGCYVITGGFKESGNTNVEVFRPDNGRSVELDEDGEARISINDSVIPGDLFDNVTVSFHPVGQQSSLCIRGNGGGAGQNVVQLYNLGDSFRFWLTRADDDSYYIDFFGGAGDYSPSNKRLDLSDNGDDGYHTVGNVVHVVKGNKTDKNKRWRFIRNADGTYYIQNKESNLYWDLEDSGYKNKNKLCQRKLGDAQAWELEIVHEDGNSTMNDLKRYDSYTFRRNGKSVTGANWMSFIPDDTVLSDVTIPGTHDSSTASTDIDMNYMAQCQQLSIYDQLYSGIRYFDLRFNGKYLIHGVFDVGCWYKGDRLKLEKVMDWVKEFLRDNPDETVILQIKADINFTNQTESEVYEYYKTLLKDDPNLFYIGDHVPKMGECRGKIVILSRFENYGNSDFRYNGTDKQWALDVSAWNAWTETMSDPMGLTVSGDNYEVWTQDFHKKVGDDKWTLTTNSVFNKETGAEAKRAAVKAKGKDCWTVSYSSCVSMGAPVKWPQEAAREQNPRLVDKLLHDEDVLDGQFLGVVCSDFSDQQLAYLVYKQNFIKDASKVTIRGITKDGEEPFEPLTLEVQKEDALDTVLNKADMITRIDKHFSGEKGRSSYMPYGCDDRTNIEQLRRKPMTAYGSAEEYAADPVHLETLHGSDRATLYVALDKAINITDSTYYDLNVGSPLCGTTVTVTGADDRTEQTPRPEFSLTDSSLFHLYEQDGITKTNWYDEDAGEQFELFEGTIEAGKKYWGFAEFEVNWGYCLNGTSGIVFLVHVTDEPKPRTSGALIIDSKHLSTRMLEIEAVHDLRQIEAEDSTCTDDGWRTHCFCEGCGKRFDPADPSREVPESDIIIRAKGHDWIIDDDTDENGWKVTKEATEDEEGEESRTCQRNGCGAVETRVIPALNHEHAMEWVEKKDATCEEDGSTGYYVCSRGDHPCGRYFTDEEGTNEIDRYDAVIPALGHTWLYPEYTWSDDNSKVTARSVCLRDHTHILQEKADAESVVTKQATCEEDGKSTLTARFENELFDEETKEVAIPALGHDWDDGAVTKEATCTETGVRTYTCKRDALHTRTEEIAPFGHGWGPVTYTWSDDMTKVTAKHVCMNECGTEEEETADVVLAETDPEPTCVGAGSKTWYSADFENDEFDPQERTEQIPALGHDWGDWVVTKEATDSEAGEKAHTCKRCEKVETEAIPKLDPEPTPTPEPTPEPAPGTDPAPAKKVSGLLLARMTSSGSRNLVISWTKVNNADGYDIFFAQCGKGNKAKRVKTVKGNKTFKWTKKSLKKKASYRTFVKAYVLKNGKKTYVRTSPTVHAYTSGVRGKYTNPKSVIVKKTSVSLKAGKTYKIKACVTRLKNRKKLMPTGHAAKLRYVSSNKKIATVSRSGKIKAKSKGSCKVYVIAVNGARKAIAVNVR